MKKRILSLLLCISLCFSMVCPSVFADDSVPEHEHQWVDCGISSFDGLIVGLPVSVTVQQCSVCKMYLHTCNILGNVIKYPAITGYTDMGNELVQFLLPYVYKLIGQNATATKAPTGIGRKDLAGYASDDGTPNYASNGELQIVVYPRLGSSPSNMYDYPANFYINTDTLTVLISGLKVSCHSLSNSSSSNFDIYFLYGFSAPVAGLYYVASRQLYLENNYYYSGFRNFYVGVEDFSKHLNVGDSGDVLNFDNNSLKTFLVPNLKQTNSTYISYFHPIVLNVIPDTPTVKQQTNITINNNTWNGNIYVDNSTNLTYIYPEYTTINENNETVTNISNNPIIYNSETKQYYTYDTVTNNYYYITYEAPATPTPSPSPSPSPAPTETPSPSESPAPTLTPDPGENPTPTPTPGGGTIITPGGDGSGSGSGSSSGITGGDDEGLFGWLWDLLKDLVKAILKAIFKVLSGLLGFLIWLVERVGILLPFLPAPAIAALGAGVVLVFVIRIIRFIRG